MEYDAYQDQDHIPLLTVGLNDARTSYQGKRTEADYKLRAAIAHQRPHRRHPEESLPVVSVDEVSLAMAMVRESFVWTRIDSSHTIAGPHSVLVCLHDISMWLKVVV